jgi:hypothetical protein
LDFPDLNTAQENLLTNFIQRLLDSIEKIKINITNTEKKLA